MRLRPFLLLALGLAACTGPERPPRPPHVTPPGCDLSRFPDIPLLPGFQPAPGEDQLAIALGDGRVRALALALEHRSGDGPTPARALAEQRRALLAAGWEARPGGRLRKGREELAVDAGREDGVTILRLRLIIPAPAPAAPASGGR
jgi:hypothetical protein